MVSVSPAAVSLAANVSPVLIAQPMHGDRVVGFGVGPLGVLVDDDREVRLRAGARRQPPVAVVGQRVAHADVGGDRRRHEAAGDRDVAHPLREVVGAIAQVGGLRSPDQRQRLMVGGGRGQVVPARDRPRDRRRLDRRPRLRPDGDGQVGAVDADPGDGRVAGRRDRHGHRPLQAGAVFRVERGQAGRIGGDLAGRGIGGRADAHRSAGDDRARVFVGDVDVQVTVDGPVADAAAGDQARHRRTADPAAGEP